MKTLHRFDSFTPILIAFVIVLIAAIGLSIFLLNGARAQDAVSPSRETIAPINPALPVFTLKDDRRLVDGDVVVSVDKGVSDGVDTTLIEAAIDIGAPPDTVWRVMTGCEEALTIVPHIQSCEIISAPTQSSPSATYSDTRRHIVQYSMFFPKTVNEFRSVYAPNRTIQFEKSGGDLKVLRGLWHLEPQSGGMSTRVIYRAELAIGQPVPGFLLRRITNGDTKEILGNLRDLSEARKLARKNDQPSDRTFQ